MKIQIYLFDLKNYNINKLYNYILKLTYILQTKTNFK